jgi:hypothetical protein
MRAAWRRVMRALCGASADGNETLIEELIAKGVRAAHGYQSPLSGSLTFPIDCMSALMTASGVKALLAAGAIVSAPSVANAVSSKNAAMLDVLLKAGGTDPEGPRSWLPSPGRSRTLWPHLPLHNRIQPKHWAAP